MSVLRPEHFGIAEVREMQIQDRVAGVFRPGTAAIVAEGDVLCLESGPFVRGRRMPRIDRHHAGFSALAEAAGVVFVHNGASGEDHNPVLFGNGNGKFTPMSQVGADRVPPTHVPPLISKGVELKKKMIFAVEIN